MSDSRVYLDHNATTPVDASLKQLAVDLFADWGNPSSIHFDGRGPKSILRESRREIANLIGADSLEIVLTSGGSEANNLALKGIFFAEPTRRHYIISAVEHPSITKTAAWLSQIGARVDVIPVKRSGEIDLQKYLSLLSADTALVSCMYANNETGSIFPIQEMSEAAHKVGALFHTDAVQALGKTMVDVKKWNVDLASFSGHKFYGLKGCGVLYTRKGLHLESLIHGGGQERGRRAGTENLLAIGALGQMARRNSEIPVRSDQMARLRDRLEQRILARIEGVIRTGAQVARIPNTSSLVIPGVDGETLLMNLDLLGFSVSTGAACSSGSPEPSPVLLAMGLKREEAQSSLRVSLGWGTTEADIDRFVEVLEVTVRRLRSFQPSEQVEYGL